MVCIPNRYRVKPETVDYLKKHILISCFQMGENFCIMYPNNSTSVIIGQTLVSDMRNLTFFIPEGTHQQAAFTCYEEVKIASAGLAVTVTKINDCKKLNDFSYLIFPCLDVDSRKTKRQLATMCKILFK